jgi:hypothetical protein
MVAEHVMKEVAETGSRDREEGIRKMIQPPETCPGDLILPTSLTYRSSK